MARRSFNTTAPYSSMFLRNNGPEPAPGTSNNSGRASSGSSRSRHRMNFSSNPQSTAQDRSTHNSACSQPQASSAQRRICRGAGGALFPCLNRPECSDSEDEDDPISSERSGLNSVQISHARNDLISTWQSHQPVTNDQQQDGSAIGTAMSALPYPIHTQVDYTHYLVPDLKRINAAPYYWGVMDRFEAEALLEGRPEGTFLLRDSAQSEYLFSVSFRRYGRTLHARIEQLSHRFSFDCYDPAVFWAGTVTGLIEHYKNPAVCLFFEPQLSRPLKRTKMFSLQHLARAAVVGSLSRYDDISSLGLPKGLVDYCRHYHYKQPIRVRRMEH